MSLRQIGAILVVAVLATGAVSPARAAIIYLEAYLDGLQEVPPNASPATGYASVQLDTATSKLSWNVAYSGLLASRTAAHFHVGPVGVSGPVTIGIAGTGGTADTIIGSATLTATQISQVLAHQWYINVHSTLYPGGEIRGQVVPEPSSAVLAALGLVGMALLGWRRFR
jgi:hypothetical protein